MTLSHSETVRPDWADYNGHMNVAYYVVVFDHATDVFLDAVGIGEAYRKEEDKSTFVVETHITYQAECHVGDDLNVQIRVLDGGDKKVHLFMTMTRNGDAAVVATYETLLLHVDMKTRQVVPMPEQPLMKIHALRDESSATALPGEVGRAVTMKRT